MHAGRGLQGVAVEVDRQRNARRDYLARLSALALEHVPEVKSMPFRVRGLNGNLYPMRDHALGQVGEFCGIPAAYIRRMADEAPDLIPANVNRWWSRYGAETRMVRTLDGTCRAFLSSRYRPLDNFDLLGVAVPTIQEAGAEVVSAEVTETRLYVKATLPALRAEVQGSRQVGDMVQAGLVVSNSEVGAGALRVEPWILRLQCLNGMVGYDQGIARYHLGRSRDADDGIRELLANDTKEADDRALWLKARDVIRGAFREDLFRAVVGRMSDATREALPARDLPAVVEVALETCALRKGLADPVMRHLIEGGDLSRWGLVNALTATANTTPDYEEATALERAGGRVLELPAREWGRIVSAN